MSSEKHNKESAWASFLRTFCCMSAASNTTKQVTYESASSAGSQSDSELRTVVDEKSERSTVIYDEPPQQLRPSTAPEAGSASQPATLDLADKMAEWELVSFPAPETPAVVKKGHRRWSSALHLTAVHERRFTSRGFHFPRKRASRMKPRAPSVIQGDDTPLPSARQNHGRPRSSSSPDELARRKAEIIHKTRAALLKDDSDSAVQEEDDGSQFDLAKPVRHTPPRPHTPPFPPPRVSMMPLPPPLPATLRSANKKRKSLTQVSYWLSRSAAPPPQVHDQVTVKEMINQCFSQADSHSRRFSDGSIATVNTCNTEDSRPILSAWSHSSSSLAGAKADECLSPRKFSTIGIKRPSPLAHVGVAV